MNSFDFLLDLGVSSPNVRVSSTSWDSASIIGSFEGVSAEVGGGILLSFEGDF